MKKLLLSLIIFGAALYIGGVPVYAQEQAASDAPATQQGDTRIEVDDENDVIRFFIKGEEVMHLDEEALHVRQDIRYGKVIIDYGQIGFETQALGVDDEDTTDAQ